ncbi:MAG TPA: hypothetical protein VFZ53_23415 [Polyangiaceae bacterium]
MKLLNAALTAPFAITFVASFFVACSQSDGTDGGGSDTGGSDSGGSSSGGAANGGTSTGGASATGGSGGTSGAAPNGGASGTGLGGSAGATPTGGASGSSGSATGGGAGVGGETGGAAGSGAGAGGSAGSGGATGGASGAYTGTIIVQDDFESATAGMQPDMAKWEQYQSFEMMLAPTVDSARKNRGQNAARVQSSNSGRGSFLVPRTGLPVAGNSFYVRVFMNWEKATTAISGHSGFIVGSAARENNGAEARLGISSKGPGNVPRMDFNLIGAMDGGGGEVTRYSNGYTDGGNPADFTGTGFQFAADRWYCVEAYYGGAMGAAEFRVWVDGSEIMEMHVTDFRGNTSGSPRVNWAPTYNFLKIGAQDYDANLGRIWYDDVFVGTAPVGCQR